MQPALTIVDNQRCEIAEVKQGDISHFGMTEKQWAQYDAMVSLELARIRTVYFTQARSFSDDEYNAIVVSWLELFVCVDQQTLHEAISRFFKADRKAFFPPPGQIMGFVEEIENERRELEWIRESVERNRRALAKMRQEDAP